MGGAPANDAFASPQALPSGLTGATEGTTAAATAEASEPMHGGTAATRSVWYEWTASSTGSVSLSAVSATKNAGVYTGSNLGSLVTIASGTEPLIFNATSGTTYRIALDSATPASFSVTLREPAPVAANDHFANSIPLTGAQGSTQATLRSATLETSEPFGFASSDTASTWWHWTAPASGPVTWQSSSSSVHVSAYLGDALGELRYISSASGATRFHAVAGTVYRICTSSFSSSIDFTLSWQQDTTAPANDNFAQAVILSTTPSSVAGTLVGSSREEGEPRHASGTNPLVDRSVWYTWTAPSDGVFRLTADSDAPPMIWVYRNDTLDTLEGIIARVRTLSLSAAAGVTYHIAVVAPAAANEQSFQFKIEGNTGNDRFADRIHLGNASQLTWEGTAKEATWEPGEPFVTTPTADYGSRWWSWTAPANGAAIIRRIEPSSSINLDLGIYTGTSLPDLVKVSPAQSPRARLTTSRSAILGKASY